VNNIFTSILDTPVGPFTIVVDPDGAVLASGWTAQLEDLLPLIHPTLRAQPLARRDLGAASRAARAYHDGDLTAPDAIAVRQHTDGPFLAAGWQTLRKVAPREQITYTQLATRTGNALASRAAAQVCARNAAALFVPCHRIVRSDGGPGGFRWGVDVKRWLLSHETGNGPHETGSGPHETGNGPHEAWNGPLETGNGPHETGKVRLP
jgi:methylated-DNA-[protein]-cysteine S-methyltransferase